MPPTAEKTRIREIIDELHGALDYEETNDVVKARRVITLTKQLLIRRPTSSGHAGSSIAYDANQLKAIQDEARVWVKCQETQSANGRGSGTIYHSPSCGFRG